MVVTSVWGRVQDVSEPAEGLEVELYSALDRRAPFARRPGENKAKSAGDCRREANVASRF